MTMDDGLITDRLARIETKQSSLIEQMEKLLGLMNRIVVLEERQHAFKDAAESRFREHDSRIKGNTGELESWKTTRRVLIGISGIVGTITAALLVGISAYILETLK